MALDMTYKKTPTASNVIASQELAQAYAEQILERIGTAAKGLHQLAANPAATPAEIIAAVGQWTRLQPGIKDGNIELLGAAVLGGATLTTAAREGAGLRATTLKEHLTNSVSRFRGLEMARGDDGWVALKMPPRTADVRVSAADPASFGSVPRHGAEGAAGGSGSDTGVVREGVSEPDRNSQIDDVSHFDVEAAMNAAVGDF